MTPTTFSDDRSRSERRLLTFEAIICLLLGVLLIAVIPPAISIVAIALGSYWLVRGMARLFHFHIEPSHWIGKGLVAALGIAAGLLVLQSPLLDLAPIGMVIIIFVGIQALLTGGTEIVVGLDDNLHSLAILGLINVVLGGVLLFHFVLPLEALPLALGSVAILGGFLSAYTAIRLPQSPRASLTDLPA